MKAKIAYLLFSILILFSCADDNSTEPNNDLPLEINFTKDIYIMHHYEGTKKLAKIDLATGNLEYVTSEINYREDFQLNKGLVYNPIDKTFIGFGLVVDNDNIHNGYIIKINQDGTTNIVYNQNTSTDFSQLTIDDMGNYYILEQGRVLDKRLMKIDITTAELDLVAEASPAQGFSNKLIYNPINGTFAGLTFYGNWGKPFLMKINPDGTTNTNNPVYINSTSETGGNLKSLVIDDLGNYYAFHNNENVKKLAKINLTTGDLNYVTPKIEFGRNTRGLVYSSIDKAFVGFDYDSNEKPFVIIINQDGTTNTVYIKEEFLSTNSRFYDLVIN